MIAQTRQGLVPHLCDARPCRGCYVVALGAINSMAVTLVQEVAKHNILANAVAVRHVVRPVARLAPRGVTDDAPALVLHAQPQT
jgi:hypothetical protein